MKPPTLYQMHQKQVMQGYEPYPFAFLLQGAPLFTWRGWLAKLFKK